MRLRPADLSDLELLRRWDEEPHVLAADPNDDWNWEVELGRRPDWREQLIAEVDGRPIGFVQIIDPAREDSHYWGDCEPELRAIDIWIGAASDLGKGMGTRIMQLAIARCFAGPDVQAILVDPLAKNRRARHFYERLGFQWVEDRRFGEDDCAVYRLERVLLRDATTDDCGELTALCLRSKASWGYDEEFMAMSRSDLTVTAERLDAWTTRLAEDRGSGGPVGVSAFSIDAHEAELELLFVDPSAFGRGIGQRLLDDVVTRLRERGAKVLWILSDPGAEEFYRCAGAERAGTRPSAVMPGRSLPLLRLPL